MLAARAITDLGLKLSELTEEIEVPEVKILGIKAGNYKAQRLLHHFFLKCFWNSEPSEQENVVTNYDWYRPAAAMLDIVHSFADEYGITIRGTRP